MPHRFARHTHRILLALVAWVLVGPQPASANFLLNLEQRTVGSTGTWGQFACSSPGANGTQAIRVRMRMGSFTPLGGGSARIGFQVQGQLASGAIFQGASRLLFDADGRFVLSGSLLTLTFDGGRVVNLSAFGGQVQADGTATLTANGADSGAPSLGCSTIGLRLSGSFAVDPQSATGGEVLKQLRLDVYARQFDQVLSKRFGTLYHRLRTGRGTLSRPAIRPSAQGLTMEADGLAAGDLGANPLGVWGSLTLARSNDNATITAFDGDRLNLYVGSDIALGENLIVGAALGYERNEFETRFNRGAADGDAWTVAPYAAWLAGEHWSVDLGAGYSWARTDQYRTDPITGARVTSEVRGRRWFLTTNLTYSQAIGAWLLSGRGGLLHAVSTDNSLTESDGTPILAQRARLGQLRLGAEAAYTGLGGFEPFASLTYEIDYAKDDLQVAGVGESDDRGGVLGLGARYYAESGVSGSLEYTTVFGRGNFSEHSVNLLMRADF